MLAALALMVPAASPAHPPAASMARSPLEQLFAEWRSFVHALPAATGAGPDYGTDATARKLADLPQWRARLQRIDRTGWSQQTIDDARLIEAEINGYDFFLRVLKPWARDPSFYATVFADQSDVPAHEGPSAEPNIDLWSFAWPLAPADDRRLTALLRTVPGTLNAARVNLAGSQAADLWRYGGRNFREQSETLASLADGTLTLRSLDGRRPATMTGASTALRQAIAEARTATDAFTAWVAAEAPKRRGPSGIGKAQYDWYTKNVLLSPYDWAAQELLLQRELDRSLASLRLEEARNRSLPPIVPIDDPVAYARMARVRTDRFNDFLVATGIIPDRPYFRAALEAQTSSYVRPAERNFFSHGAALDPLPLLSHSTHWIELARLKHEPHPDPIRRPAPLFNIFADRSEGFATAMEEIVMQAGLYDDLPHGRELVWIMLANRAARGLASLRVQANEWDLDTAGRFHAEWTPRGWSNPASRLVGFEQLLYLRQPGYGTSYILGKLQLDHLLAARSHAADQRRQPFSISATFADILAAGIVPPALIENELKEQ
ncbi:hypothetical protein [Sphingomonas mollis]|uniref:DUF885 domain-containing protein n=1 Tax=Sphingomonas mollis TaxID=2795726 RepID=A0ABS0XTU4_9SPHN|nr:hypothetical protein [Sphingomonas sp. BT553]MBJ6123464.1 hypothetical protein [Sphingomonas sp. BT553]